jgi:DNA-binding PadR family transcriptional regulator
MTTVVTLAKELTMHGFTPRTHHDGPHFGQSRGSGLRRRGPNGHGSGRPGRGGGRFRPGHGPGPDGRHLEGRHAEGRDVDGSGFRGPRGRTRRGEIRTALLSILAEAPGHGYEIIQRIETKTNGHWKPSAGSVYPTLQQLEDEGLVSATDRDGKRTFELTEAGRTEQERRRTESGEDIWTRSGDGRPAGAELFDAVKGVAMASKQVAMAGNATQIEAATEIIRTARKKLYALLAED